MKKPFIYLLLCFMLLSACNNENAEMKEQIHRLEEQKKQMADEIYRLKRSLELYKFQMSYCERDEFKYRVAVLDKNHPGMRVLLEKEFGDVNGIPAIPWEILFGSMDAILMMMKSHEIDYYYALEPRIMHAKGKKKLEYDPSTSKNHSYGTAEYMFEYLGDTAGLNVDSRLIAIFAKHYGGKATIEMFGDVVFEKSIAILNKYWFSEAERQQLEDALRFVLKTTEHVNYNATVNDLGKFENAHYEENWNGIQKFFYRMEKKVPGSTEFVRDKIMEYTK